MTDPNQAVVDDILEHAGVKGMKWGVRRARGSEGTVEGASKTKGSSSSSEHEDSSTAKVNRKKSVSSLSTKELRELNDRLQLERKNKELTAPPKNKAAEMLKQVAEQQIKNLVQQLATQQVGKLMDLAVGGSGSASKVTPEAIQSIASLGASGGNKSGWSGSNDTNFSNKPKLTGSMPNNGFNKPIKTKK